LKVLCKIRKKLVELTPEEAVRQSVLSFLINEKHFPACFISLEYPLKNCDKKKRSDILVQNNKFEKILLVECKAENVKITNDTFKQILQYNIELNAKYLLVSNGKESYCFTANNGDLTFLQEVPDFEECNV
jgi:hypothetical protein